MQLKQIYYFVQTSKYNSINETAQKLYISQPSLSVSLKALETELGFSLFLRSKQGIQLTEEGKAILGDCQKILSITDSWNRFTNSSLKSSNPVIIKAAGVLVSAVMPAFIAAFQEEYPYIKLSLQQYSDIPIYARPEPGCTTIILAQCETAQTQALIDVAQNNHWYAQQLHESPAYLFLNTQNPLCQKSHLYLEDILTQKIATFDAVKLKHYPYQSFFSMFPPDHTMHLPTREAAIGMIATTPNLIGMFSSLVAVNNHYIDNHSLTLRILDDHPMPITVVAFHSEPLPAPVTEEIFKMLRHLMPSGRFPVRQ